ncbi:MAG: hypothetical protein GWN09_03115, partial [Gammaproteobacteria bacterium]|nr:hypothetical protein [Gammaproteobacteria bacterium]
MRGLMGQYDPGTSHIRYHLDCHFCTKGLCTDERISQIADIGELLQIGYEAMGDESRPLQIPDHRDAVEVVALR